MSDLRWASGSVLVLSGFALCAAMRTPAAPILGGHDLGPAVAGVEARVSRDPGDAAALEELVEAYLERGAAGLAVAAIDRAPSELKLEAKIADARARALMDLGRPAAALASERRVLDACEHGGCSRTLLGRAERRARFIDTLLKLGVDDPLSDPERTLYAYRVATREVRLAGTVAIDGFATEPWHHAR